MGAFFIYGKLDIREVYDMKIYRSCIIRNKLCKVYDLLLRPIRCIGRSMKIHGIYDNASLCRHISRHR